MTEAVRTGRLRRDSPLACMTYAAVLMIASITLAIHARTDLIPRENLTRLAGRVEGAPWVGHGKGGPYALFHLIANDGFHTLHADYVPSRNGGMLDVRHGDRVVALVKVDLLVPSNDSVWELQRGSEILVPYEQTRMIVEMNNSSDRFISRACVLGALAFIGLGGYQRRKYGVWQIYLPYKEFS